jgi:hypothetical protein
MDLEYFNTKTARILIKLFKILRQAGIDNSTKTTVNWYYAPDDEMMEGAGQDFSVVSNMKFNFFVKD